MNNLKVALKNIPKLCLHTVLIKPSAVNRNIKLDNFIIPREKLEKLEEINDLCIKYTLCEIANFPILSTLFNNHSTKIDKLKEQYNSDIVNLNPPKSVKDINWEEVLKSNMLDKNSISNFIYNMDTLKGWSNPIMQKYITSIYSQNNIPTWIYGTKYNENIPPSLADIVKFYTYEPNTNLHYLLVSGPKLLYEFDTYDESLTKYVKLTQIDKVSICINSYLDDVKNSCHKINHIIMIEDEIEKAGNVANLVKNMDFKMIIAFCYPDKAYCGWIQAMVEATLAVPGGKECMTQYLLNSSTPIFNSIMNNPLVESCGHTLNTCEWTHKHVRDYFRLTPEEFLKSRLRMLKNNTIK